MLYDIRITPEQLKAAAEWAAWTADDGAHVELRHDVDLTDDSDTITVAQGDDTATFDADGELVVDFTREG